LQLSLKQDQLDKLKKDAIQKSPIEACALLFGTSSPDIYFVEKVVIVPNVKNSLVEFEIDPQLVLDEVNKAELKELKLIGFFHSHPADPYPSKIDLNSMRLWENYVWLIFSLTKDQMASFILRNGEIEELRLRMN
jgi:proteasome lid subunit RPN8/RPN11